MEQLAFARPVTFADGQADGMKAVLVRSGPLLTQWKSEASGDYVMALEPCNTGFRQRKQPGTCLKPLEKHTNHLTFSFLEGDAAIAELEERRNVLLHSGGYDHD